MSAALISRLASCRAMAAGRLPPTDVEAIDLAIAALAASVASAVPVAWISEYGLNELTCPEYRGELQWEVKRNQERGSTVPLYVTPQPAAVQQPLTDAQAERLYKNIKPSAQQDARSCAAFKRLVRVVEEAHGIGDKP